LPVLNGTGELEFTYKISARAADGMQKKIVKDIAVKKYNDIKRHHKALKYFFMNFKTIAPFQCVHISYYIQIIKIF
jgi:hypothetical protein